jgi:flavin-dependent dehydrogenase
LRRLAERALDGAGKEIVEARVRVHPVPAAPRCPTYADRALSVGDAAGQVKMTTGGGVYYGLLGARIASEILSEALSHDRLDRRHLARYEQLWRCLLGPEQKAGQMLRKLAHSMPDEAIDDIFRAADAQGMSRYLVDLLDFDWHARPGVGLALSMLATAPDAGRGLRWLRKLLT